jgi:hypothetical protein
MGGRRETQYEDTCVGITEPGKRPAPIVVISEGGALLARHPFTPLDEPGAEPAVDNPLLDLL